MALRHFWKLAQYQHPRKHAEGLYRLGPHSVPSSPKLMAASKREGASTGNDICVSSRSSRILVKRELPRRARPTKHETNVSSKPLALERRLDERVLPRCAPKRKETIGFDLISQPVTPPHAPPRFASDTLPTASRRPKYARLRRVRVEWRLDHTNCGDTMGWAFGLGDIQLVGGGLRATSAATRSFGTNDAPPGEWRWAKLAATIVHGFFQVSSTAPIPLLSGPSALICPDLRDRRSRSDTGYLFQGV
ncbi:hypothetical protein C8J57DRAFT_1239019 [Mycena rebaudengoi]|nr:hypothetical protein C8J57DRAFT_1239019 [Mycena rebaudengoi]